MLSIETFSAWAVWVLPLIACGFVPIVAKKEIKFAITSL